MKIRMNGRKSILLMLVLASSLITVVTINASPIMSGIALVKVPLGPPHPEWGPNTWSGTVIGAIEGNIYFYKTGGKLVGQANHFEEVWLITDNEGNMLLMGTDHGVVSLKSFSYRMNGVVTDTAPQYESLIGRNVYMSGDIYFLTPPQAHGIFRVN